MRKIQNPNEFRTNICIKLNDIIKNEKISENMEKGIFNYAITIADQKKIVKKLGNTYFVQIYLDKLRHIIHNLYILLCLFLFPY